ncbi:MAG: PAS domain S-box protein, partial [Acidobacteriota bacterium]
EVMGYSRKEFYSTDFDFMSLIAPESVDLIRSNFKRHMSGENIEPYEYDLFNKKGQKIESIITTTLINYDDEKAILGIVTDISDRKQVERELQYRLKLQNLITEVSGQFINLHPAQIDDEIEHTLMQIGEFVDADRSYIFQFSDDQKTKSCTHEWCSEGIEPIITHFQHEPVKKHPWIMKKIMGGQMVLIPRVSGLPPEAAGEKIPSDK